VLFRTLSHLKENITFAFDSWQGRSLATPMACWNARARRLAPGISS
jgi:hypothetical protein